MVREADRSGHRFKTLCGSQSLSPEPTHIVSQLHSANCTHCAVGFLQLSSCLPSQDQLCDLSSTLSLRTHCSLATLRLNCLLQTSMISSLRLEILPMIEYINGVHISRLSYQEIRDAHRTQEGAEILRLYVKDSIDDLTSQRIVNALWSQCFA